LNTYEMDQQDEMDKLDEKKKQDEKKKLDELICEKISNFRDMLYKTVAVEYHKSISDIEISADRTNVFKLYIFMGGTPEKFTEMICNKFQIDKNEKKIKIYRYVSCIFHLLSKKISTHENEKANN